VLEPISFAGMSRAGLRQILLYGALLGFGTLALQWLDYQRLIRDHVADAYAALLAAAFLALGLYIGARLFRAPPPAPFDGNPQALASLGISPRELTVLQQLAAGQSNKEIARTLGVTPNTVKTHTARLYEKLEARRRTDAVARARELGLLP
jgi:DNA-binding NarL/FixJ family response regulator